MHHIPAAADRPVPHARIAPPADPRDQCREASPPAERLSADAHAAPVPVPLPEEVGPQPGVRRRGDPNLAPRCGARARTTGCACRAPAMANGRCRMHGGKSTGPCTAEGLARLAAARTTHGKSCAAERAQQRYVATLTARMRLLGGAVRLRDFLTTELAARLASGPAELARPAEPTEWGETEVSDRTPCTLQPSGDAPVVMDRRGRAVGPRPPRGQAAEREAARAERAAQAPWRAGIKRARLVKRVVVAAWRKQRAENHRRDPMHLSAAGVGRTVPRKAHTTLDGAGMAVVHSGVPPRGTDAAAGGGAVKIATAPHATHATGHLSRWLDGAGSGAVTRAGHATVGDAGRVPGAVGDTPDGADGTGRSRQGFRSAREAPAPYDKPVAAGWAKGAAVRAIA